MKEVSISESKVKCLAILDEIQKTGQPVRITRRGKPVADVVPHSPPSRQQIFGFMKGKMKIVGDIISPATDPDDWEVLRD